MSSEKAWTIQSSSTPVAAAALNAYEAALGITFPDEYRQFLLSFNGGRPAPQQVDIPNTDHSVLVFVLYGIKEKRTAGDLAYELHRHRADLPEGYLPIGHDPGGSPFLLATAGENRGRVFFWDRTWFFEDSAAGGNTYWLADSLPALLDSLYEADDVSG
jgi:hypothetical protein